MQQPADKNKRNFFNKLTIVGGQPPRKNVPLYSSNLEKLLFKAASDEDFKEQLLHNRHSILEDPALSLSPQDKMILKSIPVVKLTDMIEKFVIQRTSRRCFLKNAAATVALLTIGCISEPIDTSSKISETGDAPLPLVTHKPVPTIDYTGTAGIIPDETPIPTSIPVDIGPQGAIVIHPYSGLKLIVPRSSLNKTTEIWITVIPEGLEYKHGFYSSEEFNNKDNFSYIMTHEFSPQNLEFKKEISICYLIPDLKYNELSGLQLVGEINWRDFEKKSQKKLPVEKSDEDYAIIKAKEFGIYTLGYMLKTKEPIFPEMTLLPSGTVRMDVNWKETDVMVNAFYMGKTEVTNKEYSQYNPNYLNTGDNLPVVNVSWYEAAKYCNWLTINSPDLSLEDCCYSGAPPNITCDTAKKGYRIPTEADWMYMYSYKENKNLDLTDIGERIYQLSDGYNKGSCWGYTVLNGCYGIISLEDKEDHTGFRLAKTA